MTSLLTAIKIKELLNQALLNMGTFEQCALLDYPDYLNIGDHLIWLGTVFYLTDVLKTKINYTASIKSFSESDMERQIGRAPILLQGGGNLGDIWSVYQEFREYIIDKYRDRPIIILPQSIYFKEQGALEKAAKIFNSHPNLTLFVRDKYSYKLAIEHFPKCRSFLAPDMGFQMAQMPGLDLNIPMKSSILYHCRYDKELNPAFSHEAIAIPNMDVEDWVSYKWIYRDTIKSDRSWYWQLPGSIKLFREVWQRGLANPPELISRYIWQYFYSYAAKLKTLENSKLHQTSWSLIHSGVYQLKQYPLIITNRLHGHILCVILKIPHIFLPNSYYKNELFYETWTYQIPCGRFVKEASLIKANIQELRELYNK